jgi:hypothetical protein
MHNPTKKQWQKVIDNLNKVLPLAFQENHLNMRNADVNCRQQCGTIHCVGGWYAVATLYGRKRLTYSDGANEMASDLGFSGGFGISDLENWAESNPDIWGNRYGYNLFCNENAYDNAETLYEVVTFLEGVRDRSPE